MLMAEIKYADRNGWHPGMPFAPNLTVGAVLRILEHIPLYHPVADRRLRRVASNKQSRNSK